MATAPTIQTFDDLERMPADGRRYELIDGVIIVSPSPSQAHQEVVWRLALSLQTFVRAGKLGRVYLAPFEIRLLGHQAVQPDILVVGNERLGILRANHAVGVPDLVVEVLSPSTRTFDEGRKLEIYAAAGVREYWLADPISRVFRPLALDDGRYLPIPQTGAVVRSVVLPGLTIDVPSLFVDLL